MIKRCIVLAAAFMAAFTISAETVKTASQPWVTNQIANAVAPLATSNSVAELAEYISSYIGEDGKLRANGFKVPWGFGGYIEFLGESIHFYHPQIHGSAGVDRTINIPVADGSLALAADIQSAIGGLAPATVQRAFSDGTTNQVGIVRSNADLVIREVETANGQRQFRLILKTN